MIDGPQLQAACVAAKIQWIPWRRCTLCDVMIGFIVEGGELYYDAACACTRYPSRPEPRSWDTTASFIEYHAEPEHKARLLKAFGVEESP